MATFHIDEHALKLRPAAVDKVRTVFNLPPDICDAHIQATIVETGMRERLQHAIEGLNRIEEIGSIDDEAQADMIMVLQKSLQAIATELSIVLYQKMPKEEVLWSEAQETIETIFDEELGDSFVSPNTLTAFNTDSACVADALLSADAQGHYSHGSERILRYIDFIRNGRLIPSGICKWIEREEYDHMGRFTGGLTFGQVGMQWGLEHGLEKARERGSYLVAGSDMSHVGRAAYAVQQAVREGFFCVGALNTNGGRAAIDMHGTERLLGTNPLVLGIPDGGDGVVIDWATTGQPEGAINVMLQAGLQAPFGLMRSADGVPVIDPKLLYNSPHALLLPSGQHKGIAQGIGVDVSTMVMAGRGRTAEDPVFKTDNRAVNNGWISMTHVEGNQHKQLLKGYREMVAGTKVYNGKQPRGLLPGVRGQMEEQVARAGNVRVPTEIWKAVLEFKKTKKLPESVKF